MQTGIILTTMSAMQLQEHLVVKEKFLFVLLSRFGQDALENFFTTLRMKNAVPSPREFKFALRSVTLSQFLRPNPRGSYACSDGEALVGVSHFTFNISFIPHLSCYRKNVRARTKSC